MRWILKLLTAPIVLTIDLFTLACVGIISCSAILFRIVSSIVALLGVMVAEHESEIILHKAAKQFFDEQGLKKLPTVKSLQAEYTQLLSEKKAIYADYQKARDEMRSLQTAKANVDRILGEDALPVEREPEKDGR